MLVVPEPPPDLSILALDTGTNTGWALLRRDGRISHGTHVLPVAAVPGRKHVRWASFRHFLVETKNAAGGLDALWYEHSEFAMMPKNAKGMAKAQVLSIMDRGALYGIIQTFCGHHGIALEPIHPSTIKKSATGNGRAKKAEVTEAVRAMGYRVEADEADAIALLYHAFADQEREAA